MVELARPICYMTPSKLWSFEQWKMVCNGVVGLIAMHLNFLPLRLVLATFRYCFMTWSAAVHVVGGASQIWNFSGESAFETWPPMQLSNIAHTFCLKAKTCSSCSFELSSSTCSSSETSLQIGLDLPLSSSSELGLALIGVSGSLAGSLDCTLRSPWLP